MPDISILLKPASSLCNMRCEYCFYHDISSKREDYGKGFMQEKTAERLIRQAYSLAAGGRVLFAFQGGEPLLRGKDFFDFFIFETKKHDPFFKKTAFSIQTNGLEIDDGWCVFFKQNGFLVGLSIDGASAENLYRRDAMGKYTTERVLRAAELLKKHRVEFNILSVITKNSALNIEKIFRFFAEERGFTHLQFIPCLRPLGGDSAYCMSVEEHTAYQKRAFDLYFSYAAKGRYVSVRHYDNLVRLAAGQRAEQCGMNGRCGLQFATEANGDIYPCDFYCTDEYFLGNINDTPLKKIAESKKAVDFVLSTVAVKEKCKECEVYRLCLGGCKRYASDFDFCSSNKEFLIGAVPKLRLLAKGLV